MKKLSKPILFFGSGPVAARSLELLAGDFVIESVITKPRPPHHKGAMPVITASENLRLPFYTAHNRDGLDRLFVENHFESSMAILIDFGILLSQKVINHFPLGIVNSHFSLLPEWRGADPITFALLSGQKTTGVSLMLLTAGMDEGPLLTQSAFNIPPGTTTPELTDALIRLSHQTLRDTLPLYVSNRLKPLPQTVKTLAANTKPTYSRRLTKEDGKIDWGKPALIIEREIRAFIEWPKSRTDIWGFDVIITKAHPINASGKPGQVDTTDRQLLIYCGEQALIIDSLKPAGKKEMTGKAFLAGYHPV